MANFSGRMGAGVTGQALVVDANGVAQGMMADLISSVADQTVAAATTAYITGSACLVPPAGLRVGTGFRWTLALSKTAAGIAARTVIVKMGTLGTTGDASIISFVMPVGTAVIDKGSLVVELIVRGPLGASCIMCGQLWLDHNLAATGFALIPTVVMQQNSAGVNSATANLIFGLALTTGAAEVITIQQCIPEARYV